MQTILTQTYLSRKPDPSAARFPAVALTLMYLLSTAYWQDWHGWGPLIAAVPEQVFGQGEYWRLFTSMFAHADLEHLLSNAVLFAVLSFMLLGHFGYFVFPVATFFLGALVMGVSLWTYPEGTHLVGASGVVYLMAGMYLGLYMLIDRRYSLASRVFRCAGFALALLMPSTVLPHVSYRTHAIGFGVGLVFGVTYYFARRRTFRAADVYEHEEEPSWSQET